MQVSLGYISLGLREKGSDEIGAQMCHLKRLLYHGLWFENGACHFNKSHIFVCVHTKFKMKLCRILFKMKL